MQADEHITGASDDTALAMALAQAVRAVGRNLAADPRRVQAMVRDVLGSESRARRAEIDAVVLAAEEAVPEDLLAERIDVSAAVDRLNDRGLAPDISLFAVAVWRYALGLLAENAEPPTLTNSVEPPDEFVAATDESATSRAVDSPTNRGLDAVSSQPTDIGGPRHEDRPAPQPTSLGTRQPAAEPSVLAAGSAARRRWVPALVLVVALAAALVFVFARDGSDEPEASPPVDTAATSTSTAVSTTVAVSTAAAPATTAPLATAATAATATATTAPPVDAAPPPPSAQFAVEPTGVGDATRVWTADGALLTGVVQVENVGDVAVSGWYYEVLPPSMVTTRDQVASLDANVQFFPFVADHVVRSLLEIPPRTTATFGYVVTLPAPPTQAQVDAWKAEQAAAASVFRAAAPAVTFDTASGGVVTSPVSEVRGTATGADVVTVNGVEVQGFDLYEAGGRWWQPLTELRPGVNEFEIVATSPYGIPTTMRWSVQYRPPTATTRAGSSGGGGGGGGGGTPTPPQPTTTTTTPRVPPPP